MIAELAERADYAGGAPRWRRSTRATACSRRARADAGQVRHQLHHHASQPGRRAGACLCRRLDPPEPWRHRDGPGADGQGGAGRRRCVRGPDIDQVQGHRDTHRQGAQHFGHRRLVGADLNGMAAQNAAPRSSAADRFRRNSVPPPRRCVPPQPACASGKPGLSFAASAKQGAYGADLTVGDRLLQDAEDPLGPRQGIAAGRSSISPMARRWRGGDRHADRRAVGASGRYPPRCRPSRSIRRSISARSRAASSRAWAG
jgi:hypothetical protein